MILFFPSYFLSFVAPVSVAAAGDIMSKDLCPAFDELRGEIKSELKNFQNSFDWDLHQEQRGMKAGLWFLNEIYEEMKSKVQVKQAENASLKRECTVLQERCQVLAQRLTEGTRDLLAKL